MENRIEKIAKNVVAANQKLTAEQQIKDEIKKNLKDALECCKDFNDKAVAKKCEHDLKEAAALLGIKL